MGNKIGKRRSSIEDRFTRPQGLYQCKDVDQKKLRRLIRESKLAPCYPGAEEPAADLDECPICFLNYPSLNRSKCCTKGICTECFLQMKSPELLQPPQCPFCKTSNYTVEYRGARSIEEKGVEQAEEQKVIEAKIRMQQKQILEECEQKQEERVAARNSGRFSASLDQESTPLATVPSQTEIEGSLPSRNIWSGAARPVIGYPHTNIFTMPPISADSGLRPHVNGASYARRGNDTFRPNILPVSNTLSLQRNYLRASNALGPLVSNTMPLSSGSPYSRYNRSDEFGLDLEEIMVMEAICLSLQDQGMPKQIGNNLATECSANQILHNSHNISTRQTSHDINTYEKEMVPCLNNGIMQDGRCSVTGGLAGTIAAMAERRLAEANSAAVQSNESSHRQSQLPSNRNSCEDNETQVDNSRALVCYGSSPHNAIYDDDDSYEEQITDTRLQIVGENRSEDLAVSEPVLTWNEPDRNSLAHLIDNLYDLQDINIRSREEQRDTEQDNGPNNNECLLTWIAPENGNLTSFLEGLYKNANLPELDAHSGYDSGGQDNSEGQTNLLTWSEVGMYEMQDNTGSTSRTKDQ